MPKFRNRREEFEAVEWQPGIDRDEVNQIDPSIVLSESKTHYYLNAPNAPANWRRADAWLPVTDGGEVIPFSSGSLNSGDQKPASEHQTLADRYIAHLGWEHMPTSYGVFFTPAGAPVSVFPGDWIVTNPDGTKRVCRKDDFAQRYEPAED